MQIYKFTNVRFFIGLTENGGNGGKFEFVKVSTQNLLFILKLQ